MRRAAPRKDSWTGSCFNVLESFRFTPPVTEIQIICQEEVFAAEERNNAQPYSKARPERPFLYVPAIHKLYFFFIIKYVTMNKCMTVNQMNKT